MAVSYDQLKDGEVLQPPADLPEPALTVNATKVLERRYLHRIDNRVVETPGGGFWRVAEEIARGSAPWVGQAPVGARAGGYYRRMARPASCRRRRATRCGSGCSRRRSPTSTSRSR